MKVLYGRTEYKVVDIAEDNGYFLFGIQDEPKDNPSHIDWVSECAICGDAVNAQEKKPKHLQRCVCYDVFLKTWKLYMYDNISKYWCTCERIEHDPDGDNHVSDYADYRISQYYPL